MATIGPFRKLIVYPSLRSVRANWDRTMVADLGCLELVSILHRQRRTLQDRQPQRKQVQDCSVQSNVLVSTLSWLRSALKRLPSFALDSCSLVTSLSGIKRKPFCRNPIRYRRIVRRILNHPLAKTSPTGLQGKKWLVLIRPPTPAFSTTRALVATNLSRYFRKRPHLPSRAFDRQSLPVHRLSRVEVLLAVPRK
jgi:hypothetical protein